MVGLSSIWVPRKDQKLVMQFLEGKNRAAVWAPGGAGKTVMAATWVAQGMDDCIVGRVLFVAPKLVARHQWTTVWQQWRHLEHLQGEVLPLKFEHLGLTRLPKGELEFRDKRGTKAALLGRESKALPGQMGLRLEGGGSGGSSSSGSSAGFVLPQSRRVHVTSWDAFPWIVKALGKDWPYDCVVFDESSFLRDQRSERGKAARHVVHRSGVVERVLELTATPAANHEEAVFSQLDLVQPGLLGSTLTEFREIFCVPESRNWQTGQVYGWKVAAGMQDEFRRRCASVAVSVPSTLSVPLVEDPLWVDLSDKAAVASADMERDSVWNDIPAGSAAVQHAKLRQMASGFVYDEAEQPIELDRVKIERLVEMVELWDEPLVVAYHWVEELDRLRAAFGPRLGEIRDKGARDRFEAGKLPILALHPASAGHGVDGLQKVCRRLVWMSVPEDRELYDQTNWRLHRHGTDADTVFVHVLVARGSREQQIWDEVLPGKATVQDLILRAARAPVEA